MIRNSFSSSSLRVFVSSWFIIPVAIGCAHKPSHKPPATQPVTEVDPKRATQEYWYDKPGVVHVPSRDYDRLFAACQAAARRFLFRVDRADYRQGLITTLPMTSAQFFELWRPDNSNFRDVEQSSLGTVRRTIHFEIESLADGTFQLTPKVLVERQVMIGRRITAAVQFRESLMPNAGGAPETADEPRQTAITTWWYPIARDHDLERRIADAVLDNLY